MVKKLTFSERERKKNGRERENALFSISFLFLEICEVLFECDFMYMCVDYSETVFGLYQVFSQHDVC